MGNWIWFCCWRGVRHLLLYLSGFFADGSPRKLKIRRIKSSEARLLSCTSVAALCSVLELAHP